MRLSRKVEYIAFRDRRYQNIGYRNLPWGDNFYYKDSGELIDYCVTWFGTNFHIN